MHECDGPLHPQAAEGLRQFNAGRYFEAHEALENAWNAERGEVRNLYRGILQVAVVYLHLTRGNFAGAIKVYERSKKWLTKWPAECKGVQVSRLRADLEAVMRRVRALDPNKRFGFDMSTLKPVEWIDAPANQSRTYICDRCGHQMHEKNCKVVCLNCGNRFDCSDLNLNFV